MAITRNLVGALMRLYRRTPLYPHAGRALARILGLLIRFRSHRIVVHDVKGIKFELDLNEVIDSSLYYAGTFEAPAEQIIESYVKPGMVAIDVGANIGCHTFHMARKAGPGGLVLAIEPMAWAFTKLQRNAGLNNFQNIRFLKLGLSNAEQGVTEVDFQSSYRLDGSSNQTRESVLITTLDAVVREQGLKSVDFIKVDVDGFEGKVIQGAEETLARFHPYIFFELSPALMKTNDGDPLELLRKLRALQYTIKSETMEPLDEAASCLSGLKDHESVNLFAAPKTRNLREIEHRPISAKLEAESPPEADM